MDISDMNATHDSGSQQSPEFKKTKLSQSAGSELPAASREFPLAISDMVRLCFNDTLSIRIPYRSPTVSTSLFSASLFLPCK